MNERLITLCFTDGETGVTLGDNYRYFTVPEDMSIVYVTTSPSVDDATCTIDINDDGSTAIAAIATAAAATPGRWRSTHVGGTNAPVRVAAGSVCSLDANTTSVDIVVHVQIWAVAGEVWS
jgi:hypothetical protein